MTAARRSRSLRAWARSLVDQQPNTGPLDLVEQVVEQVASAIAHGPAADDAPGPFADGVAPPAGGWADPWLVGTVHEQAVSAEARSARGAWYTPESVVRGLVELATAAPPAGDELPPVAIDPTCGGGAFLLAAADRFVRAGAAPAEALAGVAGMDIDPGAVQVSRWSLELWAAAHGVAPDEVNLDIVEGDALRGYPSHWPREALIIGNPPFATPLRTGAVPESVAAFREGREHLLGPYTDLAAMHLLAAVERCERGSVVALVQPQSLLAGRDSEPLRRYCEQVAPVHAMWAAREAVFDAGVRACAAVLHPGGDRPGVVQLASGPAVTPGARIATQDAIGPTGTDDASDAPDPSDSSDGTSAWAGYAARSLGAPALPSELHQRNAAERLGSLISSATAGFRDEYYGLVAACSEWTGPPADAPNRLVTVGSVEPLAHRWGVDPCRFGGERWLQPTIDVDALDTKVRTWTERRLAPKVVMATQSKLLEPVVDRDGTLVPATPLLALHADPADLDLVAAVLLSPPVVAWAWQRWFGAALAVDALKLAARQVVELPLPSDRAAWQRAADLIGRTAISTVVEGAALSDEVAAIMNDAYGADAAVLQWWRARAKSR